MINSRLVKLNDDLGFHLSLTGHLQNFLLVFGLLALVLSPQAQADEIVNLDRVKCQDLPELTRRLCFHDDSRVSSIPDQIKVNIDALDEARNKLKDNSSQLLAEGRSIRQTCDARIQYLQAYLPYWAYRYNSCFSYADECIKRCRVGVRSVCEHNLANMSDFDSEHLKGIGQLIAKFYACDPREIPSLSLKGNGALEYEFPNMRDPSRPLTPAQPGGR